MVSKGFLTN